MARSNRQHRFTVYDVMDARGVFDDNPANSTSPEYRGPIEYPKVLYHPTGATRVTQKAQVVKLADGTVEKLGELTEIIIKVVADATEESEALAKGWHDHPAKAIAAGGGIAPAMTSDARVGDLEKQIALLTAQLRRAQAEPRAEIDDEL